MSNQDQMIMDGLFRDLVEVVSSSKASLITLRCLSEAIDQLDCSPDDLVTQIDGATEVILKSRPRMFPLDNQIPLFQMKLRESGITGDGNKIKLEAKKILGELSNQLKEDLLILTQRSTEYIEDGDIIIIHSVEETVEMLLPEAKRAGKNFEVLILKQDIVKTRQVIKTMDREGIKYRIIPEYDLVHYFNEATKLFIGAQAITSDKKVVADSGTSNIVSECHIHKLPIYLFALTLEFSGKIAEEQNIYLKKQSDFVGDLEFKIQSHSHDIFQLDLVDLLITEKGEIAIEQVLDYVPLNDD
ncbi:MAG: hypothetical protein HOD97_05125 [Candidatus Marinimicrobia bacterium]|jgi:translation initiation factor 2B subunit (eIF-2B alpha/beta/delta family)|nr:hypothetical protein [Candidatus Neomarinimicrobiota bacterium]MBT3617459.1 hypothetical protein [Candidatus Neomarinimicrobiota bacterium]MBT3829399.1 hypothetical protein [Candidatus Neomarinimicrobiota bacterium]MBT3997682.1 hypothetical protein [Candidatus Neomarinimicrobiota bacterium]MBT4280980.1 hypothetical protein [Candidatus Neomarinimicrobiota bacterium]